MATGEIRIDVDNTTKTTTIVDEEITLTYEDIIEMFTDREVSVTGVTSVMMEIRNFGGLAQKILTSENNVTFKIKKITTVDTLT